MKPSVSIMLRWSAKALANDRVRLSTRKMPEGYYQI